MSKGLVADFDGPEDMIDDGPELSMRPSLNPAITPTSKQQQQQHQQNIINQKSTAELEVGQAVALPIIHLARP